jgi:hypothetical protein
MAPAISTGCGDMSAERGTDRAAAYLSTVDLWGGRRRRISAIDSPRRLRLRRTFIQNGLTGSSRLVTPR